MRTGPTRATPARPRRPGVPPGRFAARGASHRKEPHTARIAILEDELALRTLFARVLEREGHEVTTYADGETALAGILENVPDVVVSDLHVPALSGLELLRALRANRRTRGVPCILLSGSVQDDVLADTGGQGFDRWLTKPVAIDALLEAVEASLHRRDGHAA